MTNEEIIKRLSAFITCLKCEISGKECDINCATQYEAGNMGEITKMLETIVEKLEAGSWIPCSDRLPEESGYYDVTAYDGHENRTTYINFSKRNKTWYLTGRRAHWMVLAWKPRTEPYKVV